MKRPTKRLQYGEEASALRHPSSLWLQPKPNQASCTVLGPIMRGASTCECAARVPVPGTPLHIGGVRHAPRAALAFCLHSLALPLRHVYLASLRLASAAETPLGVVVHAAEGVKGLA